MRIPVILLAFTVATAIGCSKPNDEETCTPECGDAVCGDDGCGGSCGTCDENATCAEGVCAPATCGNGTLDDGETCDPSAGIQCALESGCEPLSGCFSAEFQGAPQSCDAECVTTQIDQCIDGDGCCPTTCNPGSDRDCVPDGCGNGQLDPGETCDAPEFPCVQEADCQPTDACDLATLIGYDFACVVTCQHTPITDCVMVPDGCCAPGCDYRTDGDCPAPVCGNGVVEIDEVCDTGIASGDGACPSDCDDNRACTNDTLSGADCTAACGHQLMRACQGGDGCCPPGCDTGNDADCGNVSCGDGVVDGDEGCDNAIAAGEPGSCPTDAAMCDDGDPCTDDSLEGVSGDCSARCVNTPRACANADGCCPYTCSENQDSDCGDLNRCGEMCFRAINYCLADNEVWSSTDDCLADCAQMAMGRVDDFDTDTVECRIRRLADALADPETHCPAVGTDTSMGCTEDP